MSKERNRVVALDEDQLIVHAENAIRGKPYKCLCCKCKVHRVRLPSGVCIFAKYPGEEHTGAQCRDGSAVLRDLNATDCKSFFQNLYTAPKSNKGGGGGGGPGPTGPDNDDIEVKSCSRLKHIFDMKLHLYPPKDGKLGNCCAGDFIITPDLVGKVIDSDNSLGDRVVYVMPDYCDYYKKTIRFAMIQKRGHATYKKYFLLTFEGCAKEFEEIRVQLFDDHGKAIVKTVLLAAKWETLLAPECRICGRNLCGSDTWVCKGLQRGKFRSKHQIYIPSKNYKDDAEETESKE